MRGYSKLKSDIPIIPQEFLHLLLEYSNDDRAFNIKLIQKRKVIAF